MATTPSTAIIALGRCDRGDDAAPLLLADILERRLQDAVTVVRAPGAHADVRAAFQRHDGIYAIDTLRAGGFPGTVRRVDPIREPPPSYPHPWRHLSLIDVADIATTHGAYEAVVLLGIEGRWFSHDAGISPEVAAAVHDLADDVVRAVTGDRV